MIATIKDGVLTIQPETKDERIMLTEWGRMYYSLEGDAKLNLLFPPTMKISDDGTHIVDIETGEIIQNVAIGN